MLILFRKPSALNAPNLPTPLVPNNPVKQHSPSRRMRSFRMLLQVLRMPRNQLFSRPCLRSQTPTWHPRLPAYRRKSKLPSLSHRPTYPRRTRQMSTLLRLLFQIAYRLSASSPASKNGKTQLCPDKPSPRHPAMWPVASKPL